MSNVTLVIGGRGFTVACADGEEAHVRELGSMIAAKVVESGAIAQNETRMLLFAALMLADELHEKQLALASAAPSQDAIPAAEIERRVDHIAQRLEAVAMHLEEQAATS